MSEELSHSFPTAASSAFGEEPSLSAALAAAEYSAGPSSDPAGAAGPAVQVRTDPFLVLPPELPTQTGPKGVRFDFNDGARVWLPQGAWHVEIHDAESGNIIFACDADEGWVVSSKKYYVPFIIRIWEKGEPRPLVDHTLDLRGRPVLIKFPVGTLGDLIGWFPYAEKFLKKHECLLECVLGRELIDIFRGQYPDMILNTPQEAQTGEPYASYRVGLFFGGNRDHQPIDFRQVGLHRTAGYILGVDPAEVPPRLDLDVPRRVAEPYVCIGVKSSCQAKFWNNGHGWNIVTSYLKSLGYRVLAIDREATVGMGFTWNHIPHEAEDFTGNLPLSDRIALLRHADFFIGLGSGLSWLAWACRIPVIMISGFSLPNCEFHTPYRVYSTHGCAGCWDEVAVNFDHRDFFWCPHFKGTERQYECTRLITGKQVIGHIDRLMRDHGLSAKPRSKVTSGVFCTSINPEGKFAQVLTRIVKERRPSFIVETGTYHGTGTTAAVIRGIRESGHTCRFYSLEVNPNCCGTALHNLERNGDSAFVTILNGLSVPRNALPDRETLRRELADARIEAGVYVDHPENIRADAYYFETNFPDLPDDLLARCFAECDGKPDLLILDSGGHTGLAEFSRAVELLRGTCVFALDDTLHVKHSESLRRIREDSRFTIVEEGDEKFGYCVAEFTPRS